MPSLADVLEDIRKECGIIALGILIKQGPEITSLVTGRRTSTANTPVTPDDKFHFGSCGKAITSSLIHMLINNGNLRLDTSLQSLLTEAPLHPQCAKITISQLLTHTSGLPANVSDLNALHQQARKASPTEIRKKLTYDILSERLASPASKYLYSNVGYVILGFIAETLFHLPYEEIIQKNIFDYHGMQTAGFGATDTTTPDTPSQPWGHKEENGNYIPKPFDNPTAYAPAGTIHASLSDWMKFLQEHLEYLSKRGKNKPDLHKSEIGNGTYYTDMAFMESSFNGQKYYSHDGSNTINYCRVNYYPAAANADVILIITTNASDPKAIEAVTKLTAYVQQNFVLRKNLLPQNFSLHRIS